MKQFTTVPKEPIDITIEDKIQLVNQMYIKIDKDDETFLCNCLDRLVGKYNSKSYYKLINFHEFTNKVNDANMFSDGNIAYGFDDIRIMDKYGITARQFRLNLLKELLKELKDV